MNSQAIKRISVRGLFGSYSYDLCAPLEADQPDRLLILYGDNGCGKTTVLRILFLLLSPDAARGHKTKLVGIPFNRFEVEFFSGEQVSAWRPGKKITGAYTVRVRLGKGRLKTVRLTPDEDGSLKRSDQSDAVLSRLAELRVGLYFLSDDRSLQFAGLRDSELSSSVEELKEMETLFAFESHGGDLRQRRVVQADLSPQKVLLQSLKRAEQWVQAQAVRGASEGESNVNTLYAEILKRISHLPLSTSAGVSRATAELGTRISKLEERSAQFSQYGLQPEFNGREILQIIRKARPSHVSVLNTVITPYIESVEKKLDAMQPLQVRIDTLVSLLNSFYTKKKISYTVHEGFTLRGEDGRALRPDSLSSGERHLLLLFCNTIQALDRPSIFIIDEPEISLNIKWQRRLLHALLQCAAENPVQYIFATHSFELLAQRRHNTVRLGTSADEANGSKENDRRD